MKFFNNPIKKIRLLSKIFFSAKSKQNKVFLIGTPLHGNLGDQAIVIAELEYLSNIAPKHHVVEVPSPLLAQMKPFLQRSIKPTDLILVHGGGFLGDTWQKEENMFRNVIESFPDNNIIVLPQTIYFSNSKNGQRQLAESQRIWQKHAKLTICCREKYSYDFTVKNFPSIKTILTPDIVLSLTSKENSVARTTALYCMRHDKEKIPINTISLDEATSQLPHLSTDTVVPYTIYPWERNKELEKKFKEFQRAKIIGTDRLHGMVFAYLTKTPCVVYNNANYKIDGTYTWLKTCNYLIRGDASTERIKSIINIPQQDKITINFTAYFDPLTKLIKEQLYNGKPQ